MKTAALVIVINQDKILAFIKKDQDLLSLPGGKSLPDESIEKTALREFYEETGLECQLYDDFPFEDFDTESEFFVTTFAAFIDFPWGTINEAPHSLPQGISSEGQAVWVTIDQLLEGAYSEYNAKALRHFGLLD